MTTSSLRWTLGALASLAAAWAGTSTHPWAPAEGAAESMIVQAADAATAAAAVGAVGGTVTHDLAVINAVGARLTASQGRALAARPGVARVYSDRALRSNGHAPTTYYPALSEASRLHAEGITGSGVTVAVLDTGYYPFASLNENGKTDRVLAQYDAILDSLRIVKGARKNIPLATDDNGHGTHVTSIILSSGRDVAGAYAGIAPGANLVSVKAFDATGNGTYMDVIRGIGWVVANRDAYRIRVLNCSFGAAPRSHYWDDPLNQAVMAAWKAGIVVVASAGNTGPEPMTVGVPGNVPYVITVGAVTDSSTPDNAGDDRLATFSSTGPTVEGFVKPDLLALGGHNLGQMSPDAWLARQHPELRVLVDRSTEPYFTMSGTSQAAAVASGVVALMLQASPDLGPDDVKCRLMAGARPALAPDNSLAYSVFQQGAGQINAYAAVHGDIVGCANQGLNVAKDLAGIEHYGGRANQQPGSGAYYLMGLAGYQWNGAAGGTDGYIWTDGYVWSDGYIWTDGYVWSDAFIWSEGYTWASATTLSGQRAWSLAEPTSTDVWVDAK